MMLFWIRQKKQRNKTEDLFQIGYALYYRKSYQQPAASQSISMLSRYRIKKNLQQDSSRRKLMMCALTVKSAEIRLTHNNLLISTQQKTG